MSTQKFPPGWGEQRVREVLAHYEDQTEDEQFAEIEAVREAQDITMMVVPTELAPEVRALIGRKEIESTDLETASLSTNRHFIDLIERSRASVQAEGGIPSEEIRAGWDEELSECLAK